jgi:hypothetical protein
MTLKVEMAGVTFLPDRMDIGNAGAPTVAMAPPGPGPLSNVTTFPRTT